jgi:HlyD family secretion protein
MIAENQVATAKANLDNAQANLRRMKQLFGQGAISQAQLDVAQTQYDVAKAQYDSAKQNLSLVEEGARGEDVRVAELAVAQAEEAVRTAKANAGQNALRQEDVKNAQAGVQQAKALLAIAKEALNNTNIVSSIDGIVSKRMTEPGQTCPAGGALLEVVNVQSVFFQANVSETVVSRVKTNQAVTVTVDAYPGSSFTGTVEKIYPTAAINTRNFSVRIRIPNPGSELKPGMFARGSIVSATNTGVLLVPQEAVEERNGENIVFAIDRDKVKMCTIKKGLSNAEFIEVLPPCELSDGDIVATSGHENLQDGSRVHLATIRRVNVPKH